LIIVELHTRQVGGLNPLPATFLEITVDNGLVSKTDRLAELDVLRGLAAIGVLAYHYTVIYPASYSPAEITLFKFPLGYYGPHLFFMISGFVILMTLEKTSQPFDFIVSRFSRLYPSYWAAIIVTFLITENCWLFPSLLMKVSYKDFFINFSMLQSWFNSKDVDGVYWTLAVELTFYFLIYWVYLTKNLRSIEIYALGWLAIMVLNKFFCPHVPGFFKFLFDPMLQYGELFIAGILFYNLKSKGHRWYRHVGLGLCLLVCYLLGSQRDVLVGGGHDTVVFAVLMIIFYLFILGKLGFIVQKPLVFLGTISFSLYLVHSEIGFVIKEWISIFSLGPFLNFFIPLTCSILLAALITYLIEKPAMKGIRQAYKTFIIDNFALFLL